MNWYNLYKKSMPLPDAPNYPDYINDNKDGKYITLMEYDEGVGFSVIEELHKYYPKVNYIGNGAFGIAYSLPNGNVLKMTNDPSEANVARSFIGKPTRCIVNIYNVITIQNEDNSKFSDEIYFIEMEKINTLNSNQKKLVTKMFDGYTKEDVINYLESNYIPYDIDETYKIIDDYENMCKCVMNYGLSTIDAHSENVGYRQSDGAMVLFDLGHST